MSALVITIYIKRKPITIVIDGKPEQVSTFKSTVDDTLKSKQITLGEKDKISPSLNTKISKNSTITIKRAINVSLTVEGKELKVLSAEDTIDSMLKAEGIVLKSDDKIKPEKEAKLSENMEIQIVRVEKKTLTDTASIDFKTTIKYDNNLSNSHKKVVQEGKNGVKTITNDVTYEDGKEVSRRVIGETIAQAPVDKVIVQGTLPVLPISRGGDPIPYTKVFQGRATAYSAIHGIGRTYTASGRLAVRNPEGYSTIAVDPNVIPLGTKLFVQGYGFAVAADTGSAVKGNTIDVFFDTYQESVRWAVRYVNVYILK